MKVTGVWWQKVEAAWVYLEATWVCSCEEKTMEALRLQVEGAHWPLRLLVGGEEAEYWLSTG